MTEPVIRESAPEELPALEALYPAAFPDEDLLPLLRRLLRETAGVISLVAKRDGEVVGHIAFTRCALEGCELKAALLGPLAVKPGAQRQGVGTALVAAGVERLRNDGVSRVLVLGDPAYYGRSGFSAEDAIRPPYDLPKDWAGAWQALSLDGAPIQPGARLSLPGAWRDPALWGA